MQKQKWVYVITAYRWGGRDNHSYVVAVSTSEKKALITAEKEEKYRGGKYECSVEKFLLGGVKDRGWEEVKTIFSDKGDWEVVKENRCCWCGATKEKFNLEEASPIFLDSLPKEEK